MSNDPVYVFAFTSGPATPQHHAGRRVEFIEIAGLHAAIERVGQRPALTEDALRAQHDTVVKIAADVKAILPVRFGALVDMRELETLVAMRRDAIQQALERVSERVQMTVRVFGNEGVMPGPVQSARTAGSGTAYLEQRRVQASVIPNGDAAEVSQAIHGLVVEERAERGQGRIQWMLYHLVDRSAVSEYKRTIAAFVSPTVAVTGPWPPFAFVPDLWP